MMKKIPLDIYKKERNWDYATFSNIDVIKVLLIYRDKLDISYGIKNCKDDDHDIKKLNISLICLYSDLDQLIKKCDFDNHRLSLLNKLAQGYSLRELEITYPQKPSIKSTFNTICHKIVAENNRYWVLWANDKYLHHKKKICNQCQELLPLLEIFFSPDKRNSDGYQSICKKCRQANRKKRYSITKLPK